MLRSFTRLSYGLLLRQRLGLRDMVKSPTHRQDPHGAGVLGELLAVDEVVGEPKVKGDGILDLLDISIRQLDVQSLDVLLEVLDITAAHDGEDVRRLAGDIGLGDARDDGALARRDRLERPADLGLGLGGLHDLRAALLLGPLPLLLGLEHAAAQGAPGREAHALGAAHGHDLALKVAGRRGPAALVDGELAQAVAARVLVCLGHDPGGRVRDAQVEHLAGGDEVVEGLHQLRDGRGEVPPVHVQQVDVVGLELLEAGLDRRVQALGAVAVEVDDDFLVAEAGVEVGRVLGGDDHLVADAAFLHPLADPLLRLLILVVVGRVDEVAALLVVEVQDALGCFLVASAHCGVACKKTHHPLTGKSRDLNSL